MNLVLGIANRTTGVELKSADYLKASAGDFQRALGDWTHDRDPLEWAMAQRNLGCRADRFYNVTQDAAQLHPALTALQDALTVYQSRSDRIDAAMVQSGIGSVYEGIGRYEPGVDNAKKAVEHLREAVKGIDPDKFPNAWGETQLELANELRVMSFWDKGTRDLEDAIAANQEALKVYSKQESPIHWAEAQGQLAQCLTQLAHATDNADEFHQSISIMHQVLDGYPRDRNPVEWAATPVGFWETPSWRSIISIRNPASQYPPQAVAAYRASLEELTLEHEPIAWAEAKQGLGNALKELGYNTSNADYLNLAIDAYNDFFKVIKPDQQPLQWATVKYQRGEALRRSRRAGTRRQVSQQGVQDYRDALAALPKDGQPELRDAIQEDLNIALEDLHQRGSTDS